MEKDFVFQLLDKGFDPVWRSLIWVFIGGFTVGSPLTER